MGYQVIKQPDGLLAIFSSFTDSWAVYDATPAEVVDWFAEQAAKSARRDAERIVGAIQDGKPREAYFQFAMSFEKANARSRENDGIVWADGWPDPDAPPTCPDCGEQTCDPRCGQVEVVNEVRLGLRRVSDQLRYLAVKLREDGSSRDAVALALDVMAESAEQAG